MILLLYIVINMMGIYFFRKTTNRLHILEILVYWLVAAYLFQNFSALCYMNFKTIHIPEKITYELAHFLNRIVLFPMLMVSFLNFFIMANSHFKKIGILTSYVLFLTGMEWISDFLGVFKHVHWKVWWSFAYWIGTLIIFTGFMTFFRKILFRKERGYG